MPSKYAQPGTAVFTGIFSVNLSSVQIPAERHRRINLHIRIYCGTVGAP